MSKQKGVLKLEGTIGDITFYKSQDGYLAREKPDIGHKVKTDPAFQRTRENGAEFGRAGKAGKCLRDALRKITQAASDGRVSSRLQKEMMKVLKADTTSPRGERNVLDGELELLAGFEFNQYSNLGSTLFASFAAAIDRASGKLNVTVPAFEPGLMIAAPQVTTHFKLVSAGASIDFEKGTFESAFSSTDAISVAPGELPETLLSNQLDAAGGHPMFLVFGILFFQQVNNELYSLKNGAFNALALVKVSVA